MSDCLTKTNRRAEAALNNHLLLHEQLLFFLKLLFLMDE